MDRAQADPISFQRNVILGLLLALAAAAWAVLVWQGTGADMDMAMGLANHGPARAAVPGDLGRHDGGHDVSDRRAHDPHFP